MGEGREIGSRIVDHEEPENMVHRGCHPLSRPLFTLLILINLMVIVKIIELRSS